MTAPFSVEPLGSRHDRSAFSSGSDALDRYFREQVSQDIRRRITECFVAVDGAGIVVGFYTLAAASVAVDALSDRIAKRLPRYPAVPAILIGRLAVALEHQGKGLGSALLADAVMRIDALRIGAFALIVDAKDGGAKAFYQTLGFAPMRGDERRLWIPLATALKVWRG